jgi:valyl-tRNA synthetase
VKYFPFSLSFRLPKAYEFAEVEERWYEHWLEQKTFSAKMEDGRPAFSIVIPPLNVTDVLHIGHALNNTLQDVLTRYHRMKGDNTLWVPGTDHAGIAPRRMWSSGRRPPATSWAGASSSNSSSGWARPATGTIAEAVREGRIKLYPDTWYNTFYAWMDNIRDWCISRQIWWKSSCYCSVS